MQSTFADLSTGSARFHGVELDEDGVVGSVIGVTPAGGAELLYIGGVGQGWLIGVLPQQGVTPTSVTPMSGDRTRTDPQEIISVGVGGL